VTAVDPATWSLGSDAARVAARMAAWDTARVPARVWQADPTLWPQAPPSEVAGRTGWLYLPEEMTRSVPELQTFADGVRAEGTRHVLLLGMGGSSLAPDVLRRTFGHRPGYPELIVLDSTHPDAIRAVQARIDPTRTVFVVSSKSGTTTEPLDFYRYFWETVRAAGSDPAPRFVAVTDPGSPLDALGTRERFRAVFRAVATVGGRYSALTMFGLVPAALIGADISGLLERAGRMAAASGPGVATPQNPGLSLGAALGEIAVHGRDKLTFFASRDASALPIWVEQLVAESTGKIGQGIVPVVDEPLVTIDRYGTDRQFVEFRMAGDSDPALSSHTAQLESAGHPVVRFTLGDPADVAQEFFRWELAVASAGMILGIDPFDQPDVEFAKELARQAMAHPARSGAPPEVPSVPAEDPDALARAVTAWSGQGRPGNYVAIQAYLAPIDATSRALDSLRRTLLERLRLATTVGFGPRFLHSTGQLHKGGPNTGLFLQLVDTPQQDLEVPGAGYTFGQLIRAQSVGDHQALVQKGRRVLRVDLGSDVAGGLRRLDEASGA
jgi:transaldolase/glucose-6-phosphate isomerase